MTDRELMQQALEKLEFFAHMKSVSEDTMRLIVALRERLAQPVQEPVAYWNTDESSLSFKPGRSGVWMPLYSDPKPCPTCKSLAMAVMNDQTYHENVKPKEWVGLSVNEARKFYEKYTDREELIYAIDKFLEEKNT